ncbi:PsbP-related protein [Methanobrevibacter sp.]|uniref:PsbP-related protein n=1 Tax=Methanobrevibacter sp. TaxID=66852 RepID=UPI003D7E5023
MKNNVFKRSIIIISFILLLICAFSSVNAEEDNSDITMMTLSKGGIVIHYPSNWGYSESNSNYSIMSISKLDSIDSAGVGQVNINFEKKAVQGDFYTFLNSTYNSMQKDSSFNLSSSGEVMINNIHAYEYVYSSNQNDTIKAHKAVWFEKGGQAYVMLYSAPIDEFEDNVYVFDYILSDIQIT